MAVLGAGVAARPVRENVIAGVQLAFSEPIRLDDVVVVEGEWGRIEEIPLPFVVVRIWDPRRLVLPRRSMTASERRFAGTVKETTSFRPAGPKAKSSAAPAASVA